MGAISPRKVRTPPQHWQVKGMGSGNLGAGSRAGVDGQPFTPAGRDSVSRLIVTASKDAKRKSELKKLIKLLK